ncbi:hypothetical protein A2U01_0051680, partial [Trifolium medium]|nr:hypothetical protein [Trifolium medium]
STMSIIATSKYILELNLICTTEKFPTTKLAATPEAKVK